MGGLPAVLATHMNNIIRPMPSGQADRGKPWRSHPSGVSFRRMRGLDDRVPEIPTPLSLVVIGGVLAVTTVVSLVKARRDPAARAHAGAVIGAPHRAAGGENRTPGS